ncbi:MAG TPA: SpvB/TcaC N-terminal domain-containing protein, partial [Aquabacterium sp.]|nr:SpvB/TcaC N-terminal domain-containing protein [Aquabacterium sp.]
MSDSGTATYSHAVKVPPGIGGHQPSLALIYTGSDLSPVGKGWTITGAPAITRCPASRAVDGFVGRVMFSSSDKLCLSGMRLIQTDAAGVVLPFPQTDDAKGLTGSAVREYRTESDAFVRVRAYGALNANVAAGPQYFRAWTKSGQVYEFGAGPSTTDTVITQIQTNKPAQAYVVNRITDAAGNTIDFRYVLHGSANRSSSPWGAEGGMDWGIARIDYAGNPQQGTPSRNSVVFSYSQLQNDGDQAEVWYMGQARMMAAKLDSVVTYVDTTAVSTLKVEYTKSPTTNRSLVNAIRECAGTTSNCQPPTMFTYTPGGISYTTTTAYTMDKNGVANGLQTKELKRNVPYSAYGAQDKAVGTIEGDFNGDGRTDLLVWSDDPTKHALYLSEGVGNYRLVPNGAGVRQFNITNYLFLSTNAIFRNGWYTPTLPIQSNDVDYCFATDVADVNGDGLADLIRHRGRWDCAYAESTYIFLSNGDGSFSRQTVRDSQSGSAFTLYKAPGSVSDNILNGYSQFHIGDFDRDGKADILQFNANWAYMKQTLANFAVCETHAHNWCGATLWRGVGDGSFSASALSYTFPHTIPKPFEPEVVPEQPVTWAGKVYAHYVPYSPAVSSDPAVPWAYVADLNGDGLLDMHFKSAYSSAYLGTGGPTFQYAGYGNTVAYLPYRGDFNGDGRLDVLGPITSNGIRHIGWGGSGPNWETRVLGDSTYGPAVVHVNSPPLIIDIDGDGRSDLVTTGYPTASFRRSLGNGNFADSVTVSGLNLPSQSSDSGLLISNFTGSGAAEFLIFRQESTSLLVKSERTPADLLLSVKSPSGLVSTVTYENLSSTSRYAQDRGTANAAAGSQVEALPPMTVVTRLTADSGVGAAQNVSEFGYRGYKEDNARLDLSGRTWQIDYRGFKGDDVGRRSLGFREVRRESMAADGVNKQTLSRQSLQVYPYSGSTAVQEAFLGALSPMSASQTGQLLSRTENTYCDQTAAAGAEAAATVSMPCPSTSKVRKPFLRKSIQTGADLNGTPLPTTTTTTAYSGGYPTLIQVDTVGTGPAGAQTFVKKQAFEYWPDNIAGDNWLIGLVKKSTVSNTVPNSLGSIT